MKTLVWRKQAALTLLVAFWLSTSCVPTIALYSPAAYEQAVSLKVESIALIQHATEPYDSHKREVEALILDIHKAQEFARGRPKNEISVRQWDVLMDPDKGLLGDVLDRWENEGPLSETYLNEKTPYVAAAFDQIIGLESGKVKPKNLEQD